MADSLELEEIAEQIDAMSESFAGMATAVAEQSGPANISADDLFPGPFMKTHTVYPSIETFVQDSPLDTEGEPARRQLSEEAIETYVQTVSDFDSYEEMVEAAKIDWLEREMGLL